MVKSAIMSLESKARQQSRLYLDVNVSHIAVQVRNIPANTQSCCPQHAAAPIPCCDAAESVAVRVWEECMCAA